MADQPLRDADAVVAHGCTSLRYYGRGGWRCIECFARYEVEPAWCLMTGSPESECLVCQQRGRHNDGRIAGRDDG